MAQFYPAGMLGVGLTGLMASFMSGMAGNVTAFNTVFTYDIYQGYIRRNAPDRHYLTVGRVTTIAGVALSIGTAYLAQHYNNIMDLLQLVFGFVNAPLFATFLLGMFWKRATGHGAFVGLLSGTAAAALTHGLTIAEGKGGWLLVPVSQFLSALTMQKFWIAILVWSIFIRVALYLAKFLKRATGHDVSAALVGCMTVAALTNSVRVAAGAKGGWLAAIHQFPSVMAQNFWIAIFAWTTCFVVTILVSLATRPRPESELTGLVYGLTKLPREEGVAWYLRPGPVAILVGLVLLALNIIFW
jgi:Na+/proline symporter